MTHRIKIGIVGLGSITKKVHLPVLLSFHDVEIAAASEVNIIAGEEFAKKMKIPHIFNDYNAMYDGVDLDAVFVCLPSFLHYDAVRSALEHGFHVFCEKPMGLSATEGAELVKIAKERGLILAVGYNRNLEKNYDEGAKIVKSLRLGKVLQISGTLVNPGPYAGWIPSSDWFFNDKYGVLYDSGPHLFDLIMNILNDRIVEVYASGTSNFYGVSIFDNIAGNFKTENGTIGTFNIGWKVATSYDIIQVYGTGGTLIVNPYEIIVRHGCDGPLERLSEHLITVNNIIKTYMGKIGEKTGNPNNTYFKEDRNFIDAIVKGTAISASGGDALRVLEVLDAIKESLEKNSRIIVN